MTGRHHSCVMWSCPVKPPLSYLKQMDKTHLSRSSPLNMFVLLVRSVFIVMFVMFVLLVRSVFIVMFVMFGLVWLIVINVTFNNISTIFFITSFIGEGHRSTRRKPPICRKSYNVVSSTPRLSRIRISCDRQWLHR